MLVKFIIMNFIKNSWSPVVELNNLPPPVYLMEPIRSRVTGTQGINSPTYHRRLLFWIFFKVKITDRYIMKHLHT